jgi:PTH1 family peptidyl-tRNA hydrolase
MSKKFMKFFKRKPSQKVLIFGLGNPDKKYEHTRHNVGRMIIDELVDKYASSYKDNAKLKSEIAEVFIAGKEVMLAKSKTYMNESGLPVRLMMDYFRIAPENIWIIQDDIDIALGKIKISKERGAAGHHGIESIIVHLGNNIFNRIRVGIWGKLPEEKNKEITQDYVLEKFSVDEIEILEDIKKEAISLIEVAIANK